MIYKPSAKCGFLLWIKVLPVEEEIVNQGY